MGLNLFYRKFKITIDDMMPFMVSYIVVYEYNVKIGETIDV